VNQPIPTPRQTKKGDRTEKKRKEKKKRKSVYPYQLPGLEHTAAARGSACPAETLRRSNVARRHVVR
jgi:hypothetical protein